MLQVDPEALLKTPYMFGRNVDRMRPGGRIIVGDEAYRWPVRRLSQLPPGDYTVQAILNRYETFRRANGPVIKLPPDQGEGQQWNLKPGNLYSRAVRVHVAAGASDGPVLVLDQVIPPIKPPAADTPFVRHVRLRSALLSALGS